MKKFFAVVLLVIGMLSLSAINEMNAATDRIEITQPPKDTITGYAGQRLGFEFRYAPPYAAVTFRIFHNGIPLTGNEKDLDIKTDVGFFSLYMKAATEGTHHFRVDVLHYSGSLLVNSVINVIDPNSTGN